MRKTGYCSVPFLAHIHKYCDWRLGPNGFAYCRVMIETETKLDSSGLLACSQSLD